MSGTVVATRRHWWEIVREANDALVYSALIASIVVIVFHYTGYSRVAYGLFLIVFPVGSFAVEFLRWNTTTYQIEVRGKDVYMRKSETPISVRAILGGLKTGKWQTGLKAELIRTQSSIIDRAIGYKRAWITVGGAIAFEGDRVPTWFIDMMESREIGKDAVVPEGNVAELLALFDRGILKAEEVKALVLRNANQE